jgi:glycosyltransferase involved in cell wall biosynthesis
MITPEPARKIQLGIVTRRLRQAVRSLGFESATLISYWWMFPEIAQMNLWQLRIFDLIDRHWGYEYLRNDSEAERNLALALQTAANSDRTISVSTALQAELRLHGVPSDVIPNAVDLDRVQSVLADRPIASRNKRAVYCGGWNSRLDEDLIVHLIKRNEDWDFVFVGSHSGTTVHDADNVTFLGDLAYDDALRVMQSATLGLVPFLKNEFTEASNFLKVLDYMATGAHVAATRLRSLGHWEESMPSRITLNDNLGDWDRLFDRFSSFDEDEASHPSLEALAPWGVGRRLALMLRPSE